MFPIKSTNDFEKKYLQLWLEGQREGLDVSIFS